MIVSKSKYLVADGQDGGGVLRLRRVHADRAAEQEGLPRDVTPECQLMKHQIVSS